MGLIPYILVTGIDRVSQFFQRDQFAQYPKGETCAIASIVCQQAVQVFTPDKGIVPGFGKPVDNPWIGPGRFHWKIFLIQGQQPTHRCFGEMLVFFLLGVTGECHQETTLSEEIESLSPGEYKGGDLSLAFLEVY